MDVVIRGDMKAAQQRGETKDSSVIQPQLVGSACFKIWDLPGHQRLRANRPVELRALGSRPSRVTSRTVSKDKEEPCKQQGRGPWKGPGHY